MNCFINKYAHTLMVRLKGESGFSLITTIVGLAIIACAGLALMFGLTTAIRSENIHQSEVTGEIVARGAMEYAMKQPYSSNPWTYSVTSSGRSSAQPPSWWDADNPPLLPESHAGYSVSVDAANFDADGDGILEASGDDSGIHKITVRVYSPETKLLVTLECYKVDR